VAAKVFKVTSFAKGIYTRKIIESKHMCKDKDASSNFTLFTAVHQQHGCSSSR